MQTTNPAPIPAVRPRAKPGPAEVDAGLGRGLTVTSGDGRFAMNLRARFVPRFEVELSPDGGARTRTSIATARWWIGGHVLSPRFQYGVQLAYAPRDYRDGTVSPLYDAYLDMKLHRDASLKVGQYFVPFDRMRTVREFALQMTERPRPIAELTLDRDIGLTLYSDHLGGDRSPVAYKLGVYAGAGISTTSFRPAGALFVGRVELRPLGEIDDDAEGDLDNRARPGLALGGAVAYNLNTIRQRSTTGSTFVNGTTSYLHGAADLVFKWNGFALQSEYVFRAADRDALEGVDAAGAPTVEHTRSGQGWVAQGSYHFKPGVEIAARGSQLYAREGTDPTLIDEVAAHGNEVGAGLSWYKNGHRFKVQTTWIALFGSSFSDAVHTVSAQLDLTL